MRASDAPNDQIISQLEQKRPLTGASHQEDHAEETPHRESTISRQRAEQARWRELFSSRNESCFTQQIVKREDNLKKMPWYTYYPMVFFSRFILHTAS